MENQLDELRRRAEEIVGSAYTCGVHDGRKIDYETARERGQNEAWEAARKVYEKHIAKSVFGTMYISNVFRDFTAQEAIRKIKEYEDRIAVGDEVKKDGIAFVVTGEIDHCYYGFNAEGNFVSVLKENAVKTGKHYDIQAILDDMKGDG